ncbi:Alpha/Beta hydrolase protein [Apodospora peruviana]|uniref:Alpha/Beta hydrolase protein n=1 Tax=Apodospora peruviana TaxID=516989 RepID=A0AAE0M059_9PEZI|nr:Alpha/Beta hydrolase protein [Apodospora peruviana]
MEAKSATSSEATNSFGPIHIIEPKAQHSYTAILLHGRGSDGEEFAQELLDSKLSDQKTLPEKLPGWRWVFPSSPELWSTAFEEDMPAWFEAHSLTDVTARQDLQMPGIAASVRYLDTVLNDEIERLGGISEKVVLGGISQGSAVGMWTLLRSGATGSSLSRRLGAFVGASTWLPFGANIQHLFDKDAIDSKDGSKSNEVDMFVNSLLGPLKDALAHPDGYDEFLSTPVFLGHGSDDAYVDIELGRQAKDVLSRIGLTVEWKEYSGSEQEGHWLKVPEEVDDIANFLATIMM